MKKNIPFSMKPVCLLLAGILTLSDCRPLLALAPAGREPNPALTPLTNPVNNLYYLRVPAGIGTIEEVYQAGGQETGDKGQESFRVSRPLPLAPFVVLIQDAHSVPDAQRNIRKLIEHFQKEYRVGLVALEGAASELDPQVFKSFPDKEILKETLDDYFERGELTGATAASIVSERRAVYQGIEDRKLYEEALRLYLEAMTSEPELIEKLKASRRRLQAEKEKIYSKELLEVDRALEAFSRNEMDLITVLKTLGDKGTGLPTGKAGNKSLPVSLSIRTLLEEIAKDSEDSSAVDREVREIVQRIKASLDTSSDALSRGFNEKYQAFQTSQISAAEFAVYLKELPKKGTGSDLLPIPFSAQLMRLIQHHKPLRDIQGTQFFKDFETYAQSVKESLFRSDEERTLNSQTRQLELFEKLAKVELSRREWEEIKAYSVEPAKWRDGSVRLFGGCRAYGKDFSANIEFYENAEKRDLVFFTNLIKLMNQKLSAIRYPLNASLLIAGGFHAQGLAHKFKEAGVSYAIVTPKINAIHESTPYRSLMRGEVSWKNYFKVKNGKVDLYEAFVRGVRDRLLRGQETRNKGQESSFPVPPVSRPLLKAWRDQIIRDLAQKEKLTQAGEYTQFLDEIAHNPQSQNQDIMRRQWFSRIKSFTKGLRGLEVNGQLTEQNILELLRPSTVLQAVAGNASVVRHHPFPADLLQPGVKRSEVRAKISENMVILAIKAAYRQDISVEEEAIEALAERIQEGERLTSAERVLVDAYQTVKSQKPFGSWNDFLVKAGILSESVEAKVPPKPEVPDVMPVKPASPVQQEDLPQLASIQPSEEMVRVEKTLPVVNKRKLRPPKVLSKPAPKKERKKPVRAEGRWNKDALIELVKQAMALGIPRNPGQVQRAKKIDYGDEEKNRVARELARGYNMLVNGYIKGMEGPGKWKQILEAAGDKEGAQYQGGQVAREIQWTESGVLDVIREARQAAREAENLKWLSSAAITERQEQLKEVFGQELAKKITKAYYAVRDERVVIEGVQEERKWRAALVKAGLSLEQVYDRSWRRRSEVRMSDEDKAKVKELVRRAAALIDGADMHGRARGLLPPLDSIDYMIEHIGKPVGPLDARLLGVKEFRESSLEAIEKVLVRLDVFNPARKELEEARLILSARSEIRQGSRTPAVQGSQEPARSEVRGRHHKERTAAAMDAFIQSGSWLQKAESAYARGLSRNPQVRLKEIEGIMKDLRIAHNLAKQGKAARHNLAQIVGFQGLLLLKRGNAYALLEEDDDAEKSYEDAVRMLTRALALNPFDKLARDQKGYALQALGAFYLDHAAGAHTLKEENPARVRKLIEQSIEKLSRALTYLPENERQEAQEKIQEARQMLAQIDRSEVRMKEFVRLALNGKLALKSSEDLLRWDAEDFDWQWHILVQEALEFTKKPADILSDKAILLLLQKANTLIRRFFKEPQPVIETFSSYIFEQTTPNGTNRQMAIVLATAAKNLETVIRSRRSEARGRREPEIDPRVAVRVKREDGRSDLFVIPVLLERAIHVALEAVNRSGGDLSKATQDLKNKTLPLDSVAKEYLSGEPRPFVHISNWNPQDKTKFSMLISFVVGELYQQYQNLSTGPRDKSLRQLYQDDPKYLAGEISKTIKITPVIFLPRDRLKIDDHEITGKIAAREWRRILRHERLHMVFEERSSSTLIKQLQSEFEHRKKAFGFAIRKLRSQLKNDVSFQALYRDVSKLYRGLNRNEDDFAEEFWIWIFYPGYSFISEQEDMRKVKELKALRGTIRTRWIALMPDVREVFEIFDELLPYADRLAEEDLYALVDARVAQELGFDLDDVQASRENRSEVRHNSLRDDFFEEFFGLMKRTARRYAKSQGEIREDPLIYLGAAMMGFEQARKHPSASSTESEFKRILVSRMQQRIIDQIREESPLTRTTLRDLKKLNEAIEELWYEEKKNPSFEELAEASGLSREKIQDLMILRNRKISLSRSSKKDVALGSILGERPAGDNRRLRSFLEDILDRYGKHLTQKEQYVLEQYYFDPHEPTMEEIAKKLGLTRPRVSQTHAAAIEKIKKQWLKEISAESSKTYKASSEKPPSGRAEVRLKTLKAAAAITVSVLLFDFYNFAFARVFSAHDDWRTLSINVIGFILWSFFSLGRLTRKHAPDRLNPEYAHFMLLVLPAATFSANLLASYLFPAADPSHFHASFLSHPMRASLFGASQGIWFFLWAAARSFRGVSLGMIAYLAGGWSNVAENYFFKGAHNSIPLFSGYANPADFLMAAGLGLLALDYATLFFKGLVDRPQTINKTIKKLKQQFDISEAGEYVLREYLSGVKPLEEVLDLIVGEFNIPRPVAIQYLKTAKEVFDNEGLSSSRSEMRSSPKAQIEYLQAKKDQKEAAKTSALIELPWWGKQWKEGDFRDLLRSAGGVVYMIKENSRIAGFMSLTESDKGVYLHNFAVHPANDQQEFLNDMFGRLKRQSGSRPVSTLVRESRLDIQKFFRNQGFRWRKTWPSYFPDTGEDAYEMVFEQPLARDARRSEVRNGKTRFEQLDLRSLNDQQKEELLKVMTEVNLDSGWDFRDLNQDMRREIRNAEPGDQVFQAFDPEGKLIGYAWLGHRKGDEEAEIYVIAVRKSWQRKGIGLLLTKRLIHYLAQHRVELLKLGIDLRNTSSLTFFDRVIKAHQLRILSAEVYNLPQTAEARNFESLIVFIRRIKRQFPDKDGFVNIALRLPLPRPAVVKPEKKPRSEIRNLSNLRPVLVEGFGENPAFLLHTILAYALQMTNSKIRRLEKRAEVRNDHENNFPALTPEQREKVMDLADKLLSGRFAEEMQKGEQKDLLEFLKVIHNRKMKYRWRTEIEISIRKIENGLFLKVWEIKRLMQIFGRTLKLETFLKEKPVHDHQVMMMPVMLYDPAFVDELFFSSASPLSGWEKQLLDMRYGLVHFLDAFSLVDIAKDEALIKGRGKPYFNPYVELSQDLKRIEEKAASFYKSFRLRSEMRSEGGLGYTDEDAIQFESRQDPKKPLQNFRKFSSLTGAYYFKDIDDMVTFEERFPDIWALLKELPDAYRLFMAIGELIYNAAENSRERMDPVRVTIDLFEEPSAKQDKKITGLRMTILQSSSTEDSWEKLEINKRNFDTEGTSYLNDLARRLREGARTHFGYGLSRAGYLLGAFPMVLRYERSKESPWPLTTEFYIDLSKASPGQYRPEQSQRAELRESDRESILAKTLRLVGIVQKGNVSDSVLAMHELLRMHKGLYFRIANKYRWALGRSRVMSRGDLLEAAKQGFMFGVHKFDSSGGMAFSTVVVRYILNEIHEEVNSHGISVPSQFLDQPWLFSMYSEAFSSLKQRGENPSPENLTSEIESLIRKDSNEERRNKRLEVFRSRINIEDLMKAMEARARNWLSGSQLAPDDKGKERSPFAFVIANSDLIGPHLSPEFKEWLEKVKPLLTEKEFGIVMHRLTGEPPQRDLNGKERKLENEAIAQSLGIVPDQVEALEDIALQKLRRAIGQWMADGTLDENDVRDKALRNYFLENALTVQQEVASWAKDPATGFLNTEMLLGHKIATKGRMPTFIEFLNQLDEKELNEYLNLLPDRAKKVIEYVLENPAFTQTELAKQQGVSHQAVDQYFGLAFGKAMIFANAKQDGVSSFAWLVWEMSKIIPPSRTVELLTRLKIADRDALLTVTSKQLRTIFSPKVYSLYEKKLLEFLSSQGNLGTKGNELSHASRLHFFQPQHSFYRAEVRKVAPLVVESIIAPENVQESNFSEAAREIFDLARDLKVSGFIKALNRSVRDMLKKRSELRLTPETSGVDIRTYRQASRALIHTLHAYQDFPDQRYTIGFLLPEKDSGYGSDSVSPSYVNMLGASIDTVVVAGKVTSDLSRQFKLAGKHIRLVPNLKQPVMVPGQPAVPLGIVESQQRSEVRMPMVHELFIPIAIDLEGIEDPLVKDYARHLQAVALVHTAEIIGNKPELLRNRAELRSELRKRLAISGEYDSLITLDQKQGRLGFAISGTLAQAFLRHRAEVRLASAA